MTGRMLLRLSPMVVLLALASCGGGGSTTVTVTTTVSSTTHPAQAISLRAYFLKDGRVEPVVRTVPATGAVAQAALNQLRVGVSKGERPLGLTSKVPPYVGYDLSLQNGVARFDTNVALSRLALAQVVYTLTQFPTVKAVEVGGKRYTRADFEEETPIILVDSPLPFQHVRSPLRATGTADTFEATFDYDLVASDGKVVATHFVTATSGNGQRGTFDFTVPFKTARSGLGKLVVYELSAANGQRIHQSVIPLYLEQ